jgi:ATP phosphoribosyltransferase
MGDTLKIAIQTKGRLNDESMKLIEEAGIKLTEGRRALVSAAKNFPLEILFLRDDDIPQTVADGVADIGIVGENEMLEKKENVEIAKRLGFSKCRLSLAIPKDEEYTGLDFFNTKKIATSYPSILQEFLKKNNIKAEIHVITGSVEIAPGIGLADAIFDIVSSGSTLISNRLKEVEVVITSEAVLIKNPNLSLKKQEILDELIFRMESVKRAEGKKYILLNAPNDKIREIVALLPGIKSPTIIPLAEHGWSSVHSVIEENDFWEKIGKLKRAGAEGILVIPIEKMIF